MKKTLKKIISVALSAVMLLSANCTRVFAADISTMTAQEIVSDIKVGWNLGNSLDCHGGGSNPYSAETYWGNPKTTKAMIDTVKAAGFNGVRIPTTWYDKTTNGTINSDWMNRVQEVVDYCYDNDMYVILNMHHEANIVPNSANKQASIDYITNMWTQIGNHFKGYDRHLIFEAMNEPRIIGSGDEWTTGTYETRQIISQYNQAAVDAIRATGGNNTTRLIMCPSNAAKIPASTGFTLPEDNNIVLSVHNYSPYEFAMNGGGTSSWGSSNDKTALDNELKDLYNRYVSKGTPVIIGEMGATNKNNTSAREIWAAYYTKQAKSYGIACFVWDNNATGSGGEKFGLLDRNSNSWYYPSVVKALVDGEASSTPYEPPKTEENETVIFDGSSTAEAWAQTVVIDTMPYLADGYYITITYSGDNPPLLCLQNTSTGEWNQINADSASNGIAVYNYASIKNGCKSDYTQQNQLLVMSNGCTTTVTKVSVFSAQSGSTGETAQSKTILFSGSSSAEAWKQPVTLDNVPEIKSGDYITVTYSGNKPPYLVLQRYSADEWNQMLPDKVENGVAYYSYNTIKANCASDYSLQEQLLVMSNACTTTVTEVALLSAATSLIGDVDLNGKVDINDGIMLLKHISLKFVISDSTALTNADLDGNGIIDMRDVISIMNKAA